MTPRDVARLAQALLVGTRKSATWAQARAATGAIARVAPQWQAVASRHSALAWVEPASIADQDLLATLRDEFPASHGALILDTEWDREPGPGFPLPDPDGVRAALGNTDACREERRMLDWLLGAARHLGRMPVVAGAPYGLPAWLHAEPATGEGTWASRPTAVRVDPLRHLDRWIYTPVWLTPAAALSVAQQAAADAALMVTEREWGWVAPVAAAPHAPGILTANQREAIHRIVAAQDRQVVAGGARSNGYALAVPVGRGGAVIVEAGVVEVIPPALRGARELSTGCVSYRLAWESSDLEGVHAGTLDAKLLAERADADRVIAVLEQAFTAAAGGFVLDYDGFPVG
ncbi:hypothetical protein [Rarobacter incanus]|uniref:hypothetical protein n=1 Tax=Rarobacter incanus TaxID=153494 RepID=UPI0011522ED2|nr:hypothetical protein [Rarobacter incanus]